MIHNLPVVKILSRRNLKELQRSPPPHQSQKKRSMTASNSFLLHLLSLTKVSLSKLLLHFVFCFSHRPKKKRRRIKVQNSSSDDEAGKSKDEVGHFLSFNTALH